MRISQYIDAELSRMTFLACIEVGSPAKSYSEAAVQVAVWSATGQRKIGALKDFFVASAHGNEDENSDSDSQGEGMELLPLVAWTATGTDWEIACAVY